MPRRLRAAWQKVNMAHGEPAATLIVFGGLPGTGKTTLSRALARTQRATYLRIDTIEQAIRGQALPPTAGYDAAMALAALNLSLGATVIADAVNPLEMVRQAWRTIAAEAGALLVEIELVCRDAAKHRHRVETRVSDIAGLVLPSWNDVLQRQYEPWPAPHLVIDTCHTAADAALASILHHLASMTAR